MWRVEDGKQMATMKAKVVVCLAVSKDRRRIAAGTQRGDVFVWDAKTHRKVASHRLAGTILGVDFSPASPRLVSASCDRTTYVWDITTGKVQTLQHKDEVKAAKYSPQGDRIATATSDSVRVWDSNDGRLFATIEVTVTPSRNTGLLWSNNHLFVVSDSKIQQFEASTGSAVSEWPVPHTMWRSGIALPKHGEFIAYSEPAQRTVIFWDTATHTRLGIIQHPQYICSIAVSPDDRLLAIGGQGGEITVHTLYGITVSTPPRWIVVHMDNFLTPITFRRIRSLCHVYTPHSRHQTFRSTTLRSTLGSTMNSQTRKHC